MTVSIGFASPTFPPEMTGDVCTHKDRGRDPAIATQATGIQRALEVRHIESRLSTNNPQIPVTKMRLAIIGGMVVCTRAFVPDFVLSLAVDEKTMQKFQRQRLVYLDSVIPISF